MTSRPVLQPAQVLIVSGSVGAGHDGAAYALVDRLAALDIGARVVDYLDLVPRAWARVLDDGYTKSVSYVPWAFEWLFRSIERNRVVFTGASWVFRLAERKLLRAARGADLVVATYPPATRSVGELKRRGRLRVPAVGFLTDPAPHRLWVHPSLDAHLTVTGATAQEGERLYGVPMTATGPLVPDAFTPTGPSPRARLRAELGLADGEVAVLVASGSLGLGQAGAAAFAVRSAGCTPVVLCGRNERLHRRLSREGVLALGWRDDVAQLMRSVDVLVHNAGGLSLSEAMAVGLPAVTYEPIPGHGLANAELLDRTGIAPWARTPLQLRHALHAAARSRRTPLTARDGDAAQFVAALLGSRVRTVEPGAA